MTTLIPIFGDQLSFDLTSLKAADPADSLILIAEVREEASYVPHHKKKIAFIFSAMRHFASELQHRGWTVEYTKYDDPDNAGTLSGEVKRARDRHDIKKITVTEPSEWRVLQAVNAWSSDFDVNVTIHNDDRFLCTKDEFAAWAEDRKQLRMEYFYREMRKKTGLLMDGSAPAGGNWNFDAQNRNALDDDASPPEPIRFQPDETTTDVLELVEHTFSKNFGDLEPFWFAVTHKDAEEACDHFIDNALQNFGDYQDAMSNQHKFLFHSILSLYINVGLLDPLDVCKRVAEAYDEGKIPINSAEGFIRQIIGWREYVRGIYWLKMPGYVTENYFNANRNLPEFYWTGKTDMACLSHAITQTKQDAYAHHIQRLMLTGNFALLIGVDPKLIHEWYLAVYADAFEWVELPNTLGMSQFADGGLLGSKPYAAGGNYITKMSNYCKDCRYKVSQKTGDDACPFNSLYWHFLARHHDKLKTNGRLRNVYNTWNRMSDDKRHEYLKTADRFLDALS